MSLSRPVNKINKLSVAECFPQELRDTFNDMIEAPGYITREGETPARWSRLATFIAFPDLKSTDSANSNIDQRSKSCELINNRLHKLIDEEHPRSRYSVPD